VTLVGETHKVVLLRVWAEQAPPDGSTGKIVVGDLPVHAGKRRVNPARAVGRSKHFE
jgi:hypothetical protein